MDEGTYYCYETHLYWKGRRRGLVEVAELPPITTSAPPEFQGEPGFWTPEHLLIAALETCLMTTFLAIAEKSRLQLVSYRSSTLGRLEWSKETGLGFTRIQLRPTIKIHNEQDREKVQRVMEKAERNCLVTKALGVPVTLDVRIEVSEAAEASAIVHETLPEHAA